jgi:hypothetical protein
MKLKTICCYALSVIVTGVIDSGSKLSSSSALPVSMVTKPAAEASVSSAGTATSFTGLQYVSFGGNAGN